MPLTVVVVDDNDVFRRVVVRLLTLHGFEVVADVADGASALAAVQHHRPDGVLLDVHLPDHDGLCVTRTLTAHHDAPAIVLTSTDATGCTPEELAACGARAFVLKDRLPTADLHSLFSAVGT
jgi:two-component system nitrate/nitrite response regulator NarL